MLLEGQTVPTGHAWQKDAPVVGANEPWAHAKHVDWGAGEYMPGAQTRHAVDTWSTNEPAGQVAHANTPDVLL